MVVPIVSVSGVAPSYGGRPAYVSGVALSYGGRPALVLDALAFISGEGWPTVLRNQWFELRESFFSRSVKKRVLEDILNWR